MPKRFLTSLLRNLVLTYPVLTFFVLSFIEGKYEGQKSDGHWNREEPKSREGMENSNERGRSQGPMAWLRLFRSLM